MRILGPRASRPPRARNGAQRSAALVASQHPDAEENTITHLQVLKCKIKDFAFWEGVGSPERQGVGRLQALHSAALRFALGAGGTPAVPGREFILKGRVWEAASAALRCAPFCARGGRDAPGPSARSAKQNP